MIGVPPDPPGEGSPRRASCSARMRRRRGRARGGGGGGGGGGGSGLPGGGGGGEESRRGGGVGGEVAAGAVGRGVDEGLDTPRVDCEEAEAQQAAEFAGAGVAVAAAPRRFYGQPDLVRAGHAVDALQDQLEAQAELHFDDD